MPLTDEEQKLLDKLVAKSKEEDKPSSKNGRNEQVQIIIDLSDKSATDRAVAFGILTQKDLIEGADPDPDDDVDPDDDEDDEETEEKKKPAEKPAPRKRSYFKEDAT